MSSFDMSGNDNFKIFWEKYDIDHNGKLDYEELKKIIEDLALYFKDKDLVKHTRKIFQMIDVDNDGVISKREISDFFGLN